MRKLDVKEPSRGFIENYVAGPSERALARQKTGTYMATGYGSRTIEDARKSALQICERRGDPCEIVMDNDRWRGPAK